MSVKRITIVAIATLILIGFAILSISDAVKTKDKLDFQEVQLKSKSVQIKQLDLQYEKLNQELEKAKQDKNTSQDKLNKLNKEKQELEKKTQELQSQLQAKAEIKNQAKVAAAQTTSTQSSGSVESIIRTAAAKYGISADYLVSVARCESTLNPTSVNRNYYAGGGNPTGLFQYLPETWNRISSRSPLGTQSWAKITDAYTQANVTAWAFANGYAGEWACS